MCLQWSCSAEFHQGQKPCPLPEGPDSGHKVASRKWAGSPPPPPHNLGAQTGQAQAQGDGKCRAEQGTPGRTVKLLRGWLPWRGPVGKVARDRKSIKGRHHHSHKALVGARLASQAASNVAKHECSSPIRVGKAMLLANSQIVLQVSQVSEPCCKVAGEGRKKVPKMSGSGACGASSLPVHGALLSTTPQWVGPEASQRFLAQHSPAPPKKALPVAQQAQGGSIGRPVRAEHGKWRAVVPHAASQPPPRPRPYLQV